MRRFQAARSKASLVLRSRSSRLPRILVIAAVCLAVLAWAELLVRIVGPSIAAGHFPTSTYWVAPRLVLEGRGNELYDVVAFADAAERMGALRDRGFIPNAPSAVVLLLPLGLLTESAAYTLWTLLGLAALIGATALLVRMLGASPLQTSAIFAVVPLVQPVRANFAVGQAYAFVFLALVVTGLAFRPDGSQRNWSGLGSGAAAALKSLYGAALIAVQIMGRRWHAAASGLVFLGAACAASLPIVGVEGWMVWLETTLTWRARPETTVTAYQSLTSLFGHLFRPDAAWNPSAALNLPILAEALYWIALALLGGISVLAMRGRNESSPASWRGLMPLAVVVPAALVVSPVAEDYHYMLAFFPLVVGTFAVRAEGSRSRPLLACLVAAAVLLLAPWPFNRTPVDGWWALFFYPRVYGALLLWGILVTIALRRGRRRQEG